MLAVDFHTHSLYSACGVHTVIEMLTEAARRGLAGLAITDHGPALGGHTPDTFYIRLRDPVPGIRLLKGVEANIVNEEGGIDVDPALAGWMDVVLLGQHVRFKRGPGASDWTDPLLRAIGRNACVDIITHPYDAGFPVDLERVAEAARGQGVALELNHSKIRLKRVPEEEALRFLDICRHAGCSIALCSDAHTVNEIGGDAELRPLLARAGFPEELIVNRTAESAFAFVESRRSRKQSPK